MGDNVNAVGIAILFGLLGVIALKSGGGELVRGGGEDIMSI